MTGECRKQFHSSDRNLSLLTVTWELLTVTWEQAFDFESMGAAQGDLEEGNQHFEPQVAG